MANRRAQSVDPGQPFEAPQKVLSPIGQIERPRGEADATIFAVASKLGDAVGRFGDELAQAEGRRAGEIAGADPAFRPTGGNTLRARAFDKAGSDIYVANAQARFQTELTDAFMANKDDPSGFVAASKKLLSTYERDHLYPEVTGYFRAFAANATNSLRRTALSNFEDRENDRAFGGMIDEFQSRDRSIGAILAANPNDPKADILNDDDVNARILAIEARVARGAISATQGAKMKAKVEEEGASRLLLARANALTSPEAVEAFRAAQKQRFIDGKIAGLTGFDTIDATLAKRAQALRAGQQKELTGLNRDLEDFIDRARDGWAPTSSEWMLMRKRAEALGEPGAQLIAQAEIKLQLGQQTGALPFDQAEIAVGRIEDEARASGSNPAAVDAAKHARRVLDTRRDNFARDQIGTGEREYQFQAGSIDFRAPPADLAAAVSARVPAALTIAQTAGRKAVWLRPEEREAARAALEEGGEKALGILESLVAGGRQFAPQILAEIGDGAPALAHAANVMAQTGDRSFARQVVDYQRAQKAAGGQLPSAAATDVDKIMRDLYGTALTGYSVAEVAATKAAAIAWSKVEFSRRGIDPKNFADSEDVLREAFQRARGQTSQAGVTYGGIATQIVAPVFFRDTKAQVQAPRNVRTDMFDKVIGAITNEDIAALANPPVTKKGDVLQAKALRAHEMRAVEGGYAFGAIDSATKAFTPLRGRDGKIFILPWSEIEPRLRSRMPAAFR